MTKGSISLNISRTNVAIVGSVFNDTRKVKVLSLPETIKEKSMFRAKALRRELVKNFRRRAFARNVDFSFIISGSERTFTFRVSLIFYIFFSYIFQIVCFSIYNCLHGFARRCQSWSIMVQGVQIVLMNLVLVQPV